MRLKHISSLVQFELLKCVFYLYVLLVFASDGTLMWRHEGLSSKPQVTQFEPTQLPAGVNYRANKTVKQKSLIVCKPIEMPIGIDIV